MTGKIKGKIPIVTRCSQCHFTYRRGPDTNCNLTHETVPTWFAAGIPEWCPLPDADRLLALLEMKGDTDAPQD